MDILKFVRDDIEFNIISNIDLPVNSKKVSSKEEILKEVENFDIGFFVDKEVEVITKNGKVLTFEEFVLLFLHLINASSREQVGVILPKSMPTTLDNLLTYLVIKRKDSKEFSDIYFLVNEKEIIFPYFSKEENRVFNIVKFTELLNRRCLDLDDFVKNMLYNIKND
jgi:hypothetical protein